MNEIIGLDMGTYSFKATQFKVDKGKKPVLTRYDITEDVNVNIHSEKEEDMAALSSFIKDFVTESKFSTAYVNLALPETSVFSRVIQLPNLKQKELDSAVKFEAEQYIPVPMEEVNFDYSVVLEGEENMDVLLVAASKKDVNRFVKAVSGAGLSVVGIEPESFALIRAVIPDSAYAIPTMIVRIGNKTTDITIAQEGTMRFTRTITTAGEAFTRAVAQEFGFEFLQAEEYKKSYGMNDKELEGKVGKAIEPVFSVIISEIKRALAYYRSKHGTPVKRLVLAGGVAKMPNGLFYMASSLDVEVQFCNPWIKIDYEVNIDDNDKDNLGIDLVTSIGLALKET